MDPTVDPLSPENMMCLFTGPLTGTRAATGARYMIMTKSPLTGALTTSNSGRSLPHRDEARRLRRHHPQGTRDRAGVPLCDSRQGGAASRRPPLGQGHRGDHRPAVRGDRPEGPRGLHRARRGTARALRLGDEREAPGRGALRRGRGDGLEEPEGRGDQGRGQGGPPPRSCRLRRLQQGGDRYLQGRRRGHSGGHQPLRHHLRRGPRREDGRPAHQELPAGRSSNRGKAGSRRSSTRSTSSAEEPASAAPSGAPASARWRSRRGL